MYCTASSLIGSSSTMTCIANTMINDASTLEDTTNTIKDTTLTGIDYAERDISCKLLYSHYNQSYYRYSTCKYHRKTARPCKYTLCTGNTLLYCISTVSAVLDLLSYHSVLDCENQLCTVQSYLLTSCVLSSPTC
jgi:hypothetical protein